MNLLKTALGRVEPDQSDCDKVRALAQELNILGRNETLDIPLFSFTEIGNMWSLSFGGSDLLFSSDLDYGFIDGESNKESIGRRVEASLKNLRGYIGLFVGNELLTACKSALEHCNELREAWQTGALDEHDGLGGTRSNRNVDVCVMLRNAIEKAEKIG